MSRSSKAPQPGLGYHPMTGHHNWTRIGTAGLTKRTRTGAQLGGQGAIGAELTRRNLPQSLPDALLKCRPGHGDLKSEYMAGITKIRLQLLLKPRRRRHPGRFVSAVRLWINQRITRQPQALQYPFSPAQLQYTQRRIKP